MQENRQPQQGKYVTNQQASGKNLVAAEIECRQQNERRSDAGGPCVPSSRPLMKKFIEARHSIVLRHQGPDKRAKQDLADVPMQRVKHGSVKEFANHDPEPPSERERKDREDIDPYVQK